jgi:hypothetical protein
MSQTLLLGRKINDDIVLPVAVDGSGVLLTSCTTYVESLQDVSINSLTDGDTLIYQTASNLWVNYSKTTPEFLSYIFPASSQNLGVATLATSTLTRNVIDITETLNDWTGLATNTFRVTGLTNALYKFSAVMGFRRTTTSDVSFFIQYTEGSNSSSQSNTRRALAQESAYTANANGSCTMTFIRDFRTTLPDYVHFSFQNQSAEAAQLVVQCSYILVERIYDI